jgi:hypothetical protein
MFSAPDDLKLEQRLFKSWQAWQESATRAQMAQQTLDGAQREAFDRNARFNGQLELVAGGPCNWKVDVAKQEITWELVSGPPKSEPESAGSDAETGAENLA